MPTGKTVAGVEALALGMLVLGCSSSGKQPRTGTGGPCGAPTTTTFTTKVNAERRPSVRDRRLGLDDRDPVEAERPAPDVDERPPEPAEPARPSHRGRHRPTWARPAIRRHRSAAQRRETAENFTAARPRGLHHHHLTNGATYLPTGQRGANFTDPLCDVLQCISQVGQTGCGFSNRSRRSTARSARRVAPRGERGVSAAGGLPGHHPARRRGRLLRAGQHPALLAQRRPAESGQSARPDRALPLQPVRPPLSGSARGQLIMPPLLPPPTRRRRPACRPSTSRTAPATTRGPGS